MLLTVTKKKSLMQKSTAQYLCEHVSLSWLPFSTQTNTIGYHLWFI